MIRRPIVYQGRCGLCDGEMWGKKTMKLCERCRRSNPHWKESNVRGKREGHKVRPSSVRDED